MVSQSVSGTPGRPLIARGTVQAPTLVVFAVRMPFHSGVNFVGGGAVRWAAS